MAGNLPVPQGVECKVVWNYSGNPFALNILHFRNTSSGIINQAVANSVDTAFKSAFTSSGLPGNISTLVTLARVETRDMSNNSNPWFVGSGAAVPGTGAGNPLPAATSYVITLKTGLRGRSFNGRVYLWGFTEDANDAAGGITAAASSAAAGFINTVHVNMLGITPAMTTSVVSRFTTIPPATTPIERNPPIITPVTNILARDQRWDVQRRRAVPGV